MKKDKDKERKGTEKDGKDNFGKPASSAFNQTSLLAEKKITLRESETVIKPIGRDFPGPRGVDVPLRIAVSKEAYAELIAHAKGSLDREVCGVLGGNLCEDDEGLFVNVETAIRGTAASEASTHVTFTQATWNAIHKALEQDHPKLKIVGWYHTHPGFGVEFSDMDLFIQQNFFSGSTQIALVTDPLSGAVAICVNSEGGAKYLTRFWVDGREQLCRVPARQAAVEGTGAASGDGGGGEPSIQRLEARVAQLVQALDEQRRTFQNFLLFCGTVFCFAVLLSAGYFIWGIYAARAEPPKAHLQIGDKDLAIPLDLAKQLDALNVKLVPGPVLLELMQRANLSGMPIPGLTNASPNPADASGTGQNSTGSQASPPTATTNASPNAVDATSNPKH